LRCASLIRQSGVSVELPLASDEAEVIEETGRHSSVILKKTDVRIGTAPRKTDIFAMNQNLLSEETPMRSIRAGADWVLALFRTLELSSIPYCVLAGYESLPDKPESDIDFMVSNEDFMRMPKIMGTVSKTLQVPLVQFLRHETSACFYVLATSTRGVVTFLQADPAGDFKRYGRTWLRANDVIERRRRHPRGFWIPCAADAFTYYLVKRVDKQIFLPVHGEYLSRLYKEDPSGCD